MRTLIGSKLTFSDRSEAVKSKLYLALQKAGVPDRNVTLIVAVSGGPDSTALLALLSEWSNVADGRRIIVAHFNHKLRPEADAEEALVRQTAIRFNAEFESTSADVAAYAQERKTSLHASARTLRYQFLGSLARRTSEQVAPNPVYIVTAHHLDDQIETILMRLFSGSGVEGLAGIKSISPCPGVQNIALVRPLLEIRKQNLIEYCHDRQLSFAEDRSNLDESYPRTAIRGRILPLIRATFGDSVIDSIARSGELLRLTADYVSTEIERNFNECRISATRTEIVVDYRAFSSYFCLVRLGIFQRSARILAGDDNRIPLERFQAADDCVSKSEGEIQLGAGIAVRRFRDSVHIYSTLTEWEPIRFVEGIIQIPDFGTLTVKLIPATEAVFPPSSGTLFIDAEQLNLDRAVIRPAKAGDRMWPLGASYSCSVLDMLRDAGTPHHKRQTPVLECDGVIAALLPLRIAHNYRLTAESRQAYRLMLTFPSTEI